MQILDLLGMYFDAAVVFVTNSSLLFRVTLAILCAANKRLKKRASQQMFGTSYFVRASAKHEHNKRIKTIFSYLLNLLN